MFIDTSAIIAILAKEPDATALADRIETAELRLTSARVVLETTMRLSIKFALEPTVVAQNVHAFLTEADIVFTGMDEGTASIAIKAFTDYGKGRGHPAQLNLADCMSYACAKANGVPLLYKENDFSYTDLA